MFPAGVGYDGGRQRHIATGINDSRGGGAARHSRRQWKGFHWIHVKFWFGPYFSLSYRSVRFRV
ncbi:hypothetical protein HanXRQr2_Chr09g0414511 [Helianthus annuus]|uniref:Uncharacterized protein n=1 Tax=Helianthus annuus TaxID=4232 RepID=A0A9K3NAL8_HELAN|nr:hypothetical protein HanXRQr2_Chr09g0414511 [Helianthus annuus]KAJ0713336.1 hypothetical protein HanOQP8_Chr09g0344761 [Helianthus annuus]KAJ0895443.1 hypothetical protein HanPSC8_Chr09g0400641 [Helianthus annuus]